MLFQHLSNKLQTVYFVDGQFLDQLPNSDIYQSWQFCPSITNENVDYAYFYVDGKSVENIFEEDKKEYIEAKNKVFAHLKALNVCRLDLHVKPWWKYIQKEVADYLNIKNKITKKIFETYEKPLYHDLLLNTQKLIHDIQLKSTDHQIIYNLFGTINGRMTTKKGSLPVLTMRRVERNIIKPQNDSFLSMDMNAMEPRTFLGLLNYEQPINDFYGWIKKEIYNREKDRTEIKKEFISWLYGNYKNDKYDSIFDKRKVVDKYYDGQNVKNIYGKVISCLDKDKALNYIVASTAAYVFYEQCIKLHQYLKSKKTYIKLLLHDDVLIDCDETEEIVKEMLEIYVDTRFGKFSTNMRVGLDWQNMERLIQHKRERVFLT